jgi:hypothetical protein
MLIALEHEVGLEPGFLFWRQNVASMVIAVKGRNLCSNYGVPGLGRTTG